MSGSNEPEVDTPALTEQLEGGQVSPGDTGRTGLVIGKESNEDSEGKERERSRAASPLPEEEAAGANRRVEQAEAILEESDERQEDREAAPGSLVEHRTSAEATSPTD